MQSGPAALILSILMLASVLLGAGGIWLLVKGRDSKRGLLMLVAAAVMLINVLIWAVPAPAGTPLPKDVARFVARRDSCDHWRGEDGYDAERRHQIEQAIRADCTGSDRGLATLRRKYARRADIIHALAGYEAAIE